MTFTTELNEKLGSKIMHANRIASPVIAMANSTKK